jgi:hypothetical protein
MYSAAGYRQLMLSYSGTQMMDQADRLGLLDDIETFIHNDFGVHSTSKSIRAVARYQFLDPTDTATRIGRSAGWVKSRLTLNDTRTVQPGRKTTSDSSEAAVCSLRTPVVGVNRC